MEIRDYIVAGFIIFVLVGVFIAALVGPFVYFFTRMRGDVKSIKLQAKIDSNSEEIIKYSIIPTILKIQGPYSQKTRFGREPSKYFAYISFTYRDGTIQKTKI